MILNVYEYGTKYRNVRYTTLLKEYLRYLITVMHVPQHTECRYLP